MDPITLIVSALTAGAVAALQETTGQAIKDAYKGLVRLVSRKFSGNADAKAVLEKHNQEPKPSTSKKLQKALQETKAADDKKLVVSAEKLIDLISKQEEIKTQKLVIHGDAQGVIQENRGRVTMTFNAPPPKRKKKP